MYCGHSISLSLSPLTNWKPIQTRWKELILTCDCRTICKFIDIRCNILLNCWIQLCKMTEWLIKLHDPEVCEINAFIKLFWLLSNFGNRLYCLVPKQGYWVKHQSGISQLIVALACNYLQLACSVAVDWPCQIWILWDSDVEIWLSYVLFCLRHKWSELN